MNAVLDSRLGRLPEFDARSRQFNIAEILPVKPLRSYTWSCNQWLDQGSEGACVGFSWAHELIARPKVVENVTNGLAYQIYLDAQKIDEWPGEDYSGTSVLAGAKVVKSLGYMSEYRWAFNMNDVQLAVGYSGTGIAGINWYAGMMETDINGFVRKSGQYMGGHAILVRGISLKGKYFLMRNSWGQSWGINGDCKISFDDFEALLHEQGEFCIPIKRLTPGL